MTKQAAIKAADRLQKQEPAAGPYFVVYDSEFKRFIVLSQHDYIMECAIDYEETQAQTVYCTW